MKRRAILPVLWIPAVLLAQDVHLKNRTIATSGKSPAPLTKRGAFDRASGDNRHLIVQFDHPPGIDDLDSLAPDAIPVAALPDDAVVVNGNLRRLSARPDVKWTGEFTRSDKLSRALDPTGKAALAAIVEFHADTDRTAQEAVFTRLGIAASRPAVLLPGHAVVNETYSVLQQLADDDNVAYIFPADPDLSQPGLLSPCAGMLTMSGAVAQYANLVHGWDLDQDHSAHLNYVFGTITPKVPAAVVQTEVVRAMNEWSRNVSVVFQPGVVASAARTVVVKFVSGAHGDSYPFDGPGGTLAHTFYPVPVNAESIAGDVHLDADENWHAGGDVDIFSVALHELGHAIGLGHSDKPGDVMYPYYRRGTVLSANDIGAARALYGAPGGVTSAGSVDTPPGPPAPAIPAVTPLQISVNPVASSTNSASLSLTGTVSGGTFPWTVQWTSDQGYGGKADTSASGLWSASGIALVSGVNNLSFTAFDAQHRTASQTVQLTKTAPAPGNGASLAPVSLSIVSPAGAVISTSQSALSVSGLSTGGSGIVRVVWQTAAGAAGTAQGTEHWSAVGIPLLTGTNTVIVRAYDSRGVSGWASMVVVRR